jgi:hypothetical protein
MIQVTSFRELIEGLLRSKPVAGGFAAKVGEADE